MKQELGFILRLCVRSWGVCVVMVGVFVVCVWYVCVTLHMKSSRVAVMAG